jgi:hypothetical protein
MEKPLLPTSLMSITDIGNRELSYQVIEEAARISREGWLVVQQEGEYLFASAAEKSSSPVFASNFMKVLKVLKNVCWRQRPVGKATVVAQQKPRHCAVQALHRHA